MFNMAKTLDLWQAGNVVRVNGTGYFSPEENKR